LEYLISQGAESISVTGGPTLTGQAGGDVNVEDGDGDTPIYTVENVETARFLVDHGAVLDRQNSEGVSVRSNLSWLACVALTTMAADRPSTG
jgi:hypothetical protein